MAVEVFANDALGVVSSGGTGAPAAGTVESWTVSSVNPFPSASSSATPQTSFYVCDQNTLFETEKILVTNISGTTWTVTRGADGTTPVAHAANWQVVQVVTRASLQVLQRPGSFPPSGDGTGVKDSQSIQGLITAGIPVILGPGTYTFNAAWLPSSGGSVLGAGPLLTTCTWVSTAGINAGAASVDTFEIGDMELQIPGGNANDLFTGINCQRWYVHDCFLSQNNAGNALWRGTTGAGQVMVECRFRRNRWQVFGATRTVEAIFLSSASSATQINGNSWRDEVFFNSNNDTAMYMIHLQNTGQLNQTNYFENIVFEHPYGGMIWLESHTNGFINQCYGYDMPNTTTISNPLIKISKNATGSASARTTIIGGPRIQSGAAFAAGVGDINLDANCTDTVLEALSASSSLQLFLAGSKGVKLIGMPDGGWGIQDSATTAAAGTAAGTSPPAPVVTAGPDNQSGTITFGTGTSPSAGQQVTVTFGTPFETTPMVQITPSTGAATGLGLFTAVPSATGFQVNCQTAPAASQGNATYGFRWTAWE